SPYAPHIVKELNRQGIPAYTDPETCAVALRAALPVSAVESALRVTDVPSAPDWLTPGTLNEAKSRALFDHYGLSGTDQRIVQTPSEAAAAATKLGGRVV